MKNDISDIRDLCLLPFALGTKNNMNLDNLISLFKPVIFSKTFKLNF